MMKGIISEHYLVLLLTFLVVYCSCGVNNRPIIGVITQPNNSTHSHIALNYVEWIQSAGARVAVVPFESTETELDTFFSDLNGWLIQGGPTPLITSATPYFKAAKYILNKVVDAAAKDDWVPFWGTCLGFQQLCITISEDFNLLGNFSAEPKHGLHLPLNFTSTVKDSRLFRDAPEDIMNTFATKPVTDNYHKNGVGLDKFFKSAKLKNFFNAISTNMDLKGKEFMSMIEAWNFPVYSTQFHPEHVAFDFSDPGDPNHSADAIAASQYLANFFINEARKNGHAFKSTAAEANALIYSFYGDLKMDPSSDWGNKFFFKIN